MGRNMVKIEQEFKCRVCGHDQYKSIYRREQTNNPRKESFLEYYVCPNCSVIFLDPRRFTKKETEKEGA
jgi:rubredoxin